MSDAIKHECGIALLRLKKPLSYYQEKYGTALFGINKMYLMMEKQHNRGQDGAGFASIKFDMEPGERYISRVRSCEKQPIQDIFNQISSRIQNKIDENPEIENDTDLLKQYAPYLGELMLGHVRYGTFGNNGIESVHPFLRQNNWMHRNLIVAGNFNMTNVNELFDNLISLGQHPKERADTITVMEKIGHFLDDAVHKIYKGLKKEGFNKQQASPLIEKRLKISKVLKKASKDWDGGYAMAGLLGHGDAFVLRDPSAIRPAYYYKDDEVVVVASERPVIQTVFNTSFDEIKELEAGHSIIIKKSGKTSVVPILEKRERKACSFERIYFSRGSDKEIYLERKKLGQLLFPKILKAIKSDLKNTVFSYIPNTAEISFLGMMSGVEDYLISKRKEIIIDHKPSADSLEDLLTFKPRIEKLVLKDAKLRTFIADASHRDELVAHVYDTTFEVIKKDRDSLVIIDDSIVRGTTLEKSILTLLDNLNPKKIVIISSAPQIRFPDCYGIDMSKMKDFVAFRAVLASLIDEGKEYLLEDVLEKCLADQNKVNEVNYVKELYAPFSYDQVSQKIGEIVKPRKMKAVLEVVFQTVEGLHKACPDHLGDWYFTGDYPTKGGNSVVNTAFINFMKGVEVRAY